MGIEPGDMLKELLRKKRRHAEGLWSGSRAPTSRSYNFVPKSIEEQIVIVRRFWPKLEPERGISRLGKRPKGPNAECYCLGIKHPSIGEGCYIDVMKNEVFPVLKERCGVEFCDSTDSWNTIYAHVDEHQSKVFPDTHKPMYPQETGDIYALPVQLGSRFAGFSIGAAQAKMSNGERALTALELAMVMIIYTDRLSGPSDLGMISSSEYSNVVHDSESSADDHLSGYTAFAMKESPSGGKPYLTFSMVNYPLPLDRYSVPSVC